MKSSRFKLESHRSTTPTITLCDSKQTTDRKANDFNPDQLCSSLNLRKYLPKEKPKDLQKLFEYDDVDRYKKSKTKH